MKKLFASIAFAAAVAAVTAAAVFTARTAHAAQPEDSPQWMHCDAAVVGGNWNEGVCRQARKDLEARGEAVTPDAIRSEMSKINGEDTKAFETIFKTDGPDGGAIKSGSPEPTSMFTPEEEKHFTEVFNAGGPNGGAIQTPFMFTAQEEQAFMKTFESQGPNGGAVHN